MDKRVEKVMDLVENIVDESMVARVQSGRKMVSAEAALRHAREIAQKRKPGSKPTLSDIMSAHRRLTSGIKQESAEFFGDQAHIEESFTVKDPSGKTVAVEYSEGKAKKQAELLTKKTGQKHTVKYEREAVVKEDTEGRDTVKLEIPALIRALEWAREDAEDDVAIHKFVEKLINHEGVVKMDFFSEDIDEALVFNRSYPDVDHMHGRRLSAADTNRERKFTVATNSKDGHKEHRVTVSASSANHAKNLAGEHFIKNGLDPRKHFAGLRIIEDIVPSADRKIDKNGRPYAARRIQVETNESAPNRSINDDDWYIYDPDSGKQIKQFSPAPAKMRFAGDRDSHVPNHIKPELEKARKEHGSQLRADKGMTAKYSIKESTDSFANYLPQEAVGKSNKKIAEMLKADLQRVGIKLKDADPFPGQKGTIWSVESSQYPDQVVTLEWSARAPGGRGINKAKNINLSFELYNKDGTRFEPTRMNKLNSIAAITFDGIGKIYKERVL